MYRFVVVMYLFFFFFFQAEDGIRDLTVTGVQTCALPILVSTWAGSNPAFIASRFQNARTIRPLPINSTSASANSNYDKSPAELAGCGPRSRAAGCCLQRLVQIASRQLDERSQAEENAGRET